MLHFFQLIFDKYIMPTYYGTAKAQCSVKKSQSKCGSREHLKILAYNVMTLIKNKAKTL